MGENEGRAQLGEMYPNGLLPAAGPIIRALDTDRWLKAEESTAELIACIQPNPLSEERRNAVADYVQRLIMKCFPCQVCTFGSVPLKTYLPDGDIDLTAFSHDQNLKDTWASQVRDMLEDEEKNENAEFHVKEVQYIQAEVKIIKCLVENIVVDISFNQVGGLCTLCFLDEVDHLISQDHLFKRSIILIKAWCYYESRILGAHHGLISTYALETLVLYIFHVYNNSFHGPLEVLYRFLEFFSNFDWDNYCVSLWGPVPISSLPNITAEAPRKDDGELLLNKFFLRDCSRVYAVFPGGQENNGQPFVLKHFNVIDPLRVNNNLGRSVSKGNFYRIRSAFAFGTKRLTRLLDCPKDDLINEVNQFFLNTWKRHGSGHRPDAPVVDSWETRLLSARDDHHEYGNYTNITSRNIINEHDQVLSNDEDEKYVKADQSVYNTRGRFFARTHSSPELTDAYGDVSSQSRRHRQSQTANVGATSVRIANSDRKDVGSESLVSQVRQTSVEDNSHVTHLPSHIGHDNASSDSNIYSNAYHQNFGLDPSSEDAPSSFSGAQLTHNGEQDIVNMMASASLNGLNGPVHIPLNLNSTHLPFHIPPSFLTAMGYAQWNIQGFAPTNNPLIDPSISSVQFPHSLVSPQLAHYLPSVGVNSQAEDPYDQINENLGSIEMNSTEADSDLWHDQDSCSSPSYDLENGHFKMTQSNDKPPQLVSGLKYVPPHRQTEFSSFNRVQQSSRGKRGSVGPNSDGFSLQDASSCEVFPEERSTSSRISSATRSNSLRSRTSSESSWDGSYVKISKSTKEKRGKKTAPSELVTGHGKSKNTPERIVNQADDEQQRVSRENTATDMVEMEHGSNLVSSLQDSRQHMPGYDVAQTRESDSMAPFAPMFVNSGSRQMINDNSKLVAFYPTGPPIPFFTMLPVYNIPSESGTSDASSSHFGGNETLENCESGQSLFPEEYDQSKDYKTSSSLQGATTTEASEEKKSDILNSDFDSHWQNLQLGRLCQNPRFPAPSLYPPPVMVPPVYLQGRFPYENPVRPLPVNSNLFSQLMTSYGHPLVPVPPLQSVPARPPNMYPQYMDDIPRYRSGTGTYLPNPKVAARERHSSGARRGSYTHDRNDTSGDREGNWNANSKSRASSRSYSRSQSDKSNLRVDHMSPSGNRSERSWNAHRHDSTSSDSSQNGPMHSTSGKNALQNMRYSVYPSASAGPNGISNGPSVPPAVMMYPFDHNATTYGSHEEQFEFVSLGHVNFSGLNKQSRLNEGTRSRTSEEDRTHGSSGHLSSPEQPSSPRHREVDVSSLVAQK